ncbi:glycosyltransferase family 4 protein [Pseudohyphozyma bogoriensis]|nr:glycosyltransferase family 4 protein [Pseudohyphozyma bogoriensis]
MGEPGERGLTMRSFALVVEFKPDVIQFVDPIWLCAQCIPAIQYYLPDVPLLTSYHTNLAQYATLFGFSWLTPAMWNLQRYLHGCCRLTYCPSPSTARMLAAQGFDNVRLWPRGVDTGLFRPEARDMALRRSWNVEPELSPSTSRTSLDSRSRSSSPSSSKHKSSTPAKVVILYVGRISWEKNLRLLVEAFRGLEQASVDGARPACQLVFVGDGPSRGELESLCGKYGLDAIFTGQLKGEALAHAFASADIFAFPSWTETFGQVVLESLASGLPVVGLRAEGVCDLVDHGRTGLLLDLDDLLPTTSASTISSPPPAPVEGFKPLPENPHLLVGHDAPTFSLAVSMYRDLLLDLVVNEDRRLAMGRDAATEAAKRSWHGAMEMLVDGYREIAPPVQTKTALSLSRTSTIEVDVDVVSHSAECDTYAESTAASPRAKRLGVRRVLRLGGVFRRTGGKLRESSISKPIRTWLAGERQGEGEKVMPYDDLEIEESRSLIRSILKIVLFGYAIYLLATWMFTILGLDLRALLPGTLSHLLTA